jgi:hypothetical protein
VVRYLLGIQKDSGSNPPTGSFSCSQMPGISKYFQAGKGNIPVWEQVQQTFLNIPGWGSKISWKFPTWEQVQQTSFQKSLENSGLATGFIQPTEVNHIPGQEKFDH